MLIMGAWRIAPNPALHSASFCLVFVVHKYNYTLQGIHACNLNCLIVKLEKSCVAVAQLGSQVCTAVPHMHNAGFGTLDFFQMQLLSQHCTSYKDSVLTMSTVLSCSQFFRLGSA